MAFFNYFLNLSVKVFLFAIIFSFYCFAGLQTYKVEDINDPGFLSQPVPAPVHVVTKQFNVTAKNHEEVIQAKSKNLRNLSITVENMGNGLIKSPYLYGPKGWDFRNMPKLAGQIVADDPALTNTEKAIRVHEWFDPVLWRYECDATKPSIPGMGFWDGYYNFLRLINETCGCMCGQTVDLYSGLLYYVPPVGTMYGRLTQLNHQVGEAFWDGKWHNFDASPEIRWFYYDYDNTTIVPTWLQLKNDGGPLVQRIKPWVGWEIWGYIPNGTCASTEVVKGVKGTMWNFNYNLRPDEKIIYYFDMRGRYNDKTFVYNKGYSRNPTDYGSGVFAYKPNFKNTTYKSYAIETNITQTTNGLVPTNPSQMSSIVFPFKYQWCMVGADIKAYFKTGGDVYIGTKSNWNDTSYSGVTWQKLSSSQKEYGMATGIEGRMTCWVRFDFTGSGSGLDSVEIAPEVQINPRTMAGLEYGNNHIKFEAADLGGSSVRVTYTYDDQSPYYYYEPATSNYGRHIIFRVGGTVVHSNTREAYWQKITANPQGTNPVSVQITKVSGQGAGTKVRTLKSLQQMHYGMYTWYWDGKDDAGKVCPVGMYCYKVKDGTNSEDGSRMYLWSKIWPIPNEIKDSSSNIIRKVGELKRSQDIQVKAIFMKDGIDFEMGLLKGKYSLELYNAQGQNLWNYRGETSVAGIYKTTIESEIIAHGAYFASLKQGKNRADYQFVKAE